MHHENSVEIMEIIEVKHLQKVIDVRVPHGLTQKSPLDHIDAIGQVPLLLTTDQIEADNWS